MTKSSSPTAALAPIGADRLQFYFEHQEQIDEWAALKDDARLEVQRWLTGRWAAHMDDLAHELTTRSSEVFVVERYPGEGPMLGLAKRSWQNRAGLACASIVVGVERNESSFIGESAPCVGIYVPDSSKAKAIRAKVTKPTGSGWRQETYWRIWEVVPATGDYWNDIQPYEGTLAEHVRAMWKRYSSKIDQVMR